MSDRAIWKAQLPALSARFEVRVFNFPGFDAITDMAESVLENAPRKFSIAGHSMGGRVALEIYRLASAQVDRLALLDTGIYPAHEKEPELRRGLIDTAFQDGMEAMAREIWIPSIIHPDRRDDADLVEALVAMAERHTPEEMAAQIDALLNRPDMRALLPNIACPTLVCCGREDAWASASQHSEMAGLIPGARLEIIDHCGHMTTMEHPQRLTGLMLEWLAR